MSRTQRLEPSARSTLPWWVPVIVIVGALLLIMGAVIALLNPAMLVSAGQPINEAARVYAGYLVSRNLAVAAMLLGMLSIRALRPLGSVMVLTAAVQFLDAIVDGIEGRWTIVPGVTLLGILFLVGAARALGKPLWKIDSWRDAG